MDFSGLVARNILKEFDIVTTMILYVYRHLPIDFYLQHSAFAFAGERLTRRLRKDSYDAMLHQDMTWFDEEANYVGALTTRLATDTALVKQVRHITQIYTWLRFAHNYNKPFQNVNQMQ